LFGDDEKIQCISPATGQYPYSTRFRVDRLLLYDRQGAGGVGLSAQAAPMFHLLLIRAFETISGCVCEAGCPSCIHHAECPSYNTVLSKAGGLVSRMVNYESGDSAKSNDSGPESAAFMVKHVHAFEGFPPTCILSSC
jgi:ATP-dependent helicase YprA (DUF1998 family)